MKIYVRVCNRQQTDRQADWQTGRSKDRQTKANKFKQSLTKSNKDFKFLKDFSLNPLRFKNKNNVKNTLKSFDIP